ncbi:bifunctional diguanylate cyclase/phosphodiesterase [Candidatus Synechococcus calcipolaris G9]|uniref:Bifunctional diguanylate cyclase/phosphodiesterase n=1 Tax=Candidatus Synechococcus calcipolaris G9 TaxID=1497997 RepID=A0ABT6F142_9SYNE|nr:bifunctional diguanylate cyclase/phosphodiesterase [Candidatus Synechococcus calcipolaris]MDG2991585.1 bifunctional diguanylate cyclase/phosphodiesterase [Candidatus Synechococcus calcipolaris G9]
MTDPFELMNWHKKTKYPFILLILLMVAGVYFFVYATGGVKYVFPHSMYLPIIFSAIVFGIAGGLLSAILGGIVLGPFMPIDTMTGETQQTINWLYRMGFFALVGSIVGFASDRMLFYVKQIKWLANYDSTTGLPNRISMENFIQSLPDLSEKNRCSHFLLGIALSNADEIEMHFGANAVNQVFSHLACLASSELPSNPSVYRLGHNCLGVVLLETTETDMRQKTENLKKALQKPFAFGSLHLHGDIYLGSVVLESAINEPGKYIEKVRYAVSEATAKKQQGEIVVCSEHDARIRENIELLGELMDGLQAGQLTMHYQPKVITQTGYIYGAEALMRWNHPVRGKIPPNLFIPRAEESTLIDQITYFAMDQALGQIATWEQNGLKGMQIAVNISTRNLMSHDFDKTVRQLLDSHGVKGENLELEITENSFMEYVESSLEKLTTLSKSNIVLSIDDFGTGYSSLQYLAKLPISVIKIDQAFIRGLPNNVGAKYIVEAAINLAHKLDMKVVAEGVETLGAYDFLRNVGCDIIQGYYASRPITAGEFNTLYQECGGRLLQV